MISVVVVTFNSAHVIAQCLGPLDGEPDVELVIVDNASTDDTVAQIRLAAPTSRILQNPENFGFARAVNIGAAEANGDILVLLNPDAHITPATLRSLAARLNEGELVGAIAPLVTTTEDNERVIAAGMTPSIWRMFTHMSGLSALPFSGTRGHYLLRKSLGSQSSIEVDWVSGGCMLVKTSAFRLLDGLTERWFMYAEDIDFCLRLGERGYRVLLVPELRATHESGQSTLGIDGRVSTVWLEHLYELYCLRFAPGPNRRRLWAWIVGFGFEMRSLALRLRGLNPRLARPYDVQRFQIYADSTKKLTSRETIFNEAERP